MIPGFMLLREWSGEDAAGWFLSEKFDGCRVGWDGPGWQVLKHRFKA